MSVSHPWWPRLIGLSIQRGALQKRYVMRFEILGMLLRCKTDGVDFPGSPVFLNQVGLAIQ